MGSTPQNRQWSGLSAQNQDEAGGFPEGWENWNNSYAQLVYIVRIQELPTDPTTPTMCQTSMQ